MFSRFEPQPEPRRRRHRSAGLLLFVALMMGAATLAFLWELGLLGPRAAPPARPAGPSDAPVEVIFLDEEPQTGSADEQPAIDGQVDPGDPGRPQQEGGG